MKSREQSLESRRLDGDTFRLDAAGDHHPGAATDQFARGVVGYWRPSFAREHDVERIDEIGRGIDQGAVEVENDGWGGHGGSLAHDPSEWKTSLRAIFGYPGDAIGAR